MKEEEKKGKMERKEKIEAWQGDFKSRIIIFIYLVGVVASLSSLVTSASCLGIRDTRQEVSKWEGRKQERKREGKRVVMTWGLSEISSLHFSHTVKEQGTGNSTDQTFSPSLFQPPYNDSIRK